ncbi:MAG: sigma-54-dependent Fis family transcriptional regulator [Candidatus Hydrogenedentes bacterium]|nr:sigma-54-dependent Fis family transcriptional regulator [Candidatus Hydrogenedentota bacterium]
MARILVVDDEANMRRVLCALLTQRHHETAEADGVKSARRLIAAESWDVVFTDQRMKDGEGMEILAACAESELSPPVIMLTAFGSVDLAVKAMRHGAFDFITKPFDPDAVLAAVNRACLHTKLTRENARLRDEVRRLSGLDDLIGESRAMTELRHLIQRVAATDATALITGETGTGKELVARGIHRNSRRAKNPFVAVNCAAMPEALLESQLFGHERGAFTGADRARSGLFEAADGGTLFLDEAGEMPLPLQAKLLRVLVDQQITRVGSTAARKVDVRILVATHRNLEERVREGAFREDLYYRLAVVPVPVPALRDHPADIPALTTLFLKAVADDMKVPERTIAAQALQALCTYHFPGNVRELRNLIERAYILGKKTELTSADFPVSIVPAEPSAERRTVADTILGRGNLDAEPIDLRATLEQVERDLIIRALEAAGGAQAEAARRLRISRSDLAYKVNKYDLRSHLSV